MMKMTFKRSFPLILILFSIPFYSLSQTKETIVLDYQLSDETTDLSNNGRYDDLIKLNQMAIEQSKKLGYREGIISGYCNLSNVSSRLGNYKQSILFIDLAEKENESYDNKAMTATIEASKGMLNFLMDRYQASIQYFGKALHYSKYIPNSKKQSRLRIFCYKNLVLNFEAKGKIDSVFYYSKKAFADSAGVYQSSAVAHAYITFNNKEIDSTEHYLHFAEKTALQGKTSKVDRYVLKRVWGEYYEAQAKYDSAKIYYGQMLDLGKQLHSIYLKRDAYWFLKNIDELTNNKEGLIKNLLAYSELSDCIDKNRKMLNEIPLQHYIADSQKAYSLKEKTYQYTALLVFIFFISLLFFIIKKLKKEKELKNRIEMKKKKLLEKENETKELKSKVNDSFEEVITLAKKNNPEFVTRFIEVYPDFYQALLRVYPDINTENLKFCALLRLNFSTKDIADYNFITPRAIQLRKNRLRKKLNIASTEDIYTWMNNLDQR